MSRRLAELLALGQYAALAREVESEFGIRDVDPERLRQACLFAGAGWTCDARMWLKNRLGEAGILFKRTNTDEANERRTINFPVTLHCFFLGVEETPEHLARLRNEHLGPSDQRAEAREGPQDTLARSKVFSTTQVVHPINRVAARVSRDQPHNEEELRALAATRPREVAKRQQTVLSSTGEAGLVVGIRKCHRKDCRGVILLTRWPDGEETKPCTSGMKFDGKATWLIPAEETPEEDEPDDAQRAE